MTLLPSLASLSLHDEPTEAPRGERIEYRRGIPFANRRRYKLSGSLLAKWCGLGGVSRASIVKTMRDFHGVYTITLPTALCAAVQWGKDHEPDAMRAYQETTRLRLSLGSTRGAPFGGRRPPCNF